MYIFINETVIAKGDGDCRKMLTYCEIFCKKR